SHFGKTMVTRTNRFGRARSLFNGLLLAGTFPRFIQLLQTNLVDGLERSRSDGFEDGDEVQEALGPSRNHADPRLSPRELRGSVPCEVHRVQVDVRVHVRLVLLQLFGQ